MKDLFHDKPNDLRIVRVSEYDASEKSDHLYSLRSKLLNSEDMYPDIKKWVDKKVTKGLITGERVGYIGYIGDNAVASAIVKRGSDAKFCHLKLDEGLQKSGLGDLLFTLMALEVRSEAKKVHFTLPEGLWEDKRSFFESFSFSKVWQCHKQYRLFERELRSETNYKNLYSSILDKLQKLSAVASIGGYSMDNQLLISVSAKYAEKIMLGEKTVEIRRKFSPLWEGVRVNIYASSPLKSLLGEARLARVIEIKPEKAWEYFSVQIGSTKEEFDRYVNGLDKIYALILDEIKPYMSPIYIQQLDHLLGATLKAPQSYSLMSNNPVWAKAVSLAAVLQGQRSNRKLSVEQSCP